MLGLQQLAHSLRSVYVAPVAVSISLERSELTYQHRQPMQQSRRKGGEMIVVLL